MTQSKPLQNDEQASGQLLPLLADHSPLPKKLYTWEKIDPQSKRCSEDT
jgi:hypothetical protein